MSEQTEFEPAPVTPSVAPKKRNPFDMVLIAAAVIALAGVAFATGRLTAPAAAAGVNGPGGFAANGGFGGRQRGSFDPNASFQPGQGRFGGQLGGPGGLGGGGLTVTGTVTAVSATEITIQLANGTSVTIPVDTATTYHAQTEASASDVKTGGTVEVRVSGVNRNPAATAAPGSSGGSGGQLSLGPATSVTVIP